MKTYLLDTCVVSDFFKGVGNTRPRMHALSPAQIAISAVTVMEVLYGFDLNPAVKHRFSVPFHSLCSASDIIPFDNRVAEVAATIRASLKRSGTPIGVFDLLIGTTALAHGHVLVSSNLREFEKIHGLTVEDWRD